MMSINDILISDQWPHNIAKICYDAIPVITQAEEVGFLTDGQKNSLVFAQDVAGLMVLTGKSWLGQPLTDEEKTLLSDRLNVIKEICGAMNMKQEDELRYLLKDSLLAKGYLDQIRVGFPIQVLQYGWTRGYLRSVGAPLLR